MDESWDLTSRMGSLFILLRWWETDESRGESGQYEVAYRETRRDPFRPALLPMENLWRNFEMESFQYLISAFERVLRSFWQSKKKMYSETLTSKIRIKRSQLCKMFCWNLNRWSNRPSLKKKATFFIPHFEAQKCFVRIGVSECGQENVPKLTWICE